IYPWKQTGKLSCGATSFMHCLAVVSRNHTNVKIDTSLGSTNTCFKFMSKQQLEQATTSAYKDLTIPAHFGLKKEFIINGFIERINGSIRTQKHRAELAKSRYEALIKAYTETTTIESLIRRKYSLLGNELETVEFKAMNSTFIPYFFIPRQDGIVYPSSEMEKLIDSILGFNPEKIHYEFGTEYTFPSKVGIIAKLMGLTPRVRISLGAGLTVGAWYWNEVRHLRQMNINYEQCYIPHPTLVTGKFKSNESCCMTLIGNNTFSFLHWIVVYKEGWIYDPADGSYYNNFEQLRNSYSFSVRTLGVNIFF
ncbi:hypothetical protein IB642_02415, partial [Allofrancisella guangzhouensis]